jgi:hypothetical protein
VERLMSGAGVGVRGGFHNGLWDISVVDSGAIRPWCSSNRGCTYLLEDEAAETVSD